MKNEDQVIESKYHTGQEIWFFGDYYYYLWNFIARGVITRIELTKNGLAYDIKFYIPEQKYLKDLEMHVAKTGEEAQILREQRYREINKLDRKGLGNYSEMSVHENNIFGTFEEAISRCKKILEKDYFECLQNLNSLKEIDFRFDLGTKKSNPLAFWLRCRKKTQD